MVHFIGEKEDGEGGGGEEEKKRQKRGGKGIMKARKKEDGPKQVCVSRAPRGKKKSVTVVTGLSTFGECRVNMFLSVSSEALFNCLCTLTYRSIHRTVHKKGVS
jgi:hypothetical protein